MGDPEFQVSGGAGGTGARYEDIGVLAAHSDDLARDLAGISVQGHNMLVDPDLVASAVLNPGGFAKIEAGLLNALDGPDGLSALSLGFGERAIALRTVVTSYQAVDEAQARAIDTLRWAAGYGLGGALQAGVLAPGLALPLVAPLGVAGAVFGDDIDWDQLMTEHPGIVDNLVGLGPGLISSLPGTPMVSDVPGAADLLGQLYEDGTHQTVERGVDDTHDSMRFPPRDFADLIDGLDWRNREANAGQPDQIDVRVITNPDGSRAYVVDIPGTKEWNHPFQQGYCVFGRVAVELGIPGVGGPLRG
ncbi:hypothetical protein O7626_14485 [Micromonospora sp. WMMD1102]|uniref:hypothetical protein n=1 Tax=Micromonospora sp. WMMD1102 TaxID=3016105 RepID=UPI0024157B28|nr:hypothetical protein [Micromonospora sp. WMMD1102]MDG4787122.1 hypothetical protein [Micromonospora sp. WMMD1102]